MKIHDLEVQPIDRITGPSCDEVADIISDARRPLIFAGLDRDFEFLRDWNLDFFSKIHDLVRAQQPEPDGVNHFVRNFQIPMTEFVRRIRAGDDLYMGARQIMKGRGERAEGDGLGALASQVKLPPWIDRDRIYSANLWVGAGNNRTLLHYDPWDGVLMLAAGTKDFILFPDHETSRMHPYGALDFKGMYTGKVLHSKIRPLHVQEEYAAEFGKAQGFRGTLGPGEMIFIPAGFWHYVESFGLNIGINFFIHVKDRTLHLREPLRTYWIKDKITLWPIRAVYYARNFAGRTFRRFWPKRMST